MRRGLAVSAIGQTGQSEAIHSPEAWASTVVRLTMPVVWSTAVACITAISSRECPAGGSAMAFGAGARNRERSVSSYSAERVAMQRSSPSIGGLAAALAKAQAEIINPEKSTSSAMRRSRQGLTSSARRSASSRVSSPLLDICNYPTGMGLEPAAIELLGHQAELHDEIAGEVR